MEGAGAFMEARPRTLHVGGTNAKTRERAYARSGAKPKVWHFPYPPT